MPLGDRILRAVERKLMPWFDRDQAEQAMVHAEELHQTSIATRIEAEKVIATVKTRAKDAAARRYRERLTGIVEPKS